MLETRTDNQTGHSTPRRTKKAASVTGLPGRSAIDAALMSRIVNGADRSALAELAEHYAPRLKSFLMYRGEQAQTAEDIVQDVIILVWTKSGQFNAERGSFSSWVYRMTRNKWIDHKRKHDRQQPTAPDILAVLSDDIVEAADVDFERTEASIAVRKHMAELPTEQKQMLQLAFFEGLTHNQISERTGLALGTVKSRIRASLKKLRGGLEIHRGVINE